MMPSAKSILLICASVLTVMTSADAADSRFIASLGKLDPQTRLEQVCDLAAVNHIGLNGSFRNRIAPNPTSLLRHGITATRSKAPAAHSAAAENGTHSHSNAGRRPTTSTCCRSPIAPAR
jgi:hypothetical protein